MTYTCARDLFKVGVGPSSSHTMGPMIAAARFAAELADPGTVTGLQVDLYGSLGLTGKGHATDRAIILGLSGLTPETLDPGSIDDIAARVRDTAVLLLNGEHAVSLDPKADIHFLDTFHEAHANTLRIVATDAAGLPVSDRLFISVGGGFVEEVGGTPHPQPQHEVPHVFQTAVDLLDWCDRLNCSIADVARRNEVTVHGADRVVEHLGRVHVVMRNCIDRGLAARGELPGDLGVTRRAAALWQSINDPGTAEVGLPDTWRDRVSAFAIAVNEENAAGGRVVTAPTTGAAGIVPAVLRFYTDLCVGATDRGVEDFLLTAAAVGSLLKRNAGISGADLGCQGEVGSACAMAAAGLAAALGGTPAQVENAAEIGLEHNLGLTCDPVGGLVQVPCIERNAIGAGTAVTAASLALRGTGHHLVSLDAAITTLRQTGHDMSFKYKETSLAGLAINVAAC